jgi:acetoacetyl-CoA synthetase
VLVVRQVPRTINGKKLEVPIKKILMGTPREKALNEDTLANPESIEELLHKVAEVTGPGTE